MQFNKPINKNNILIKAQLGKDNTANIKDKIITFYFNKNNLVDTGVFARELSKTLFKYKDQQITFDLSSFLNTYETKCKFSLACMILTKLDAFIEKSFSLKTKAKCGETNLIYNKEDAEIVKNATTVAWAIHLARQYQIMPANYLGINKFVDEINNLFKKLNAKNLKVKVLREKEIKAEGMELLQAVNNGSDEPTALVVIEYFNNKQSKDTLAYVGKGVMFDAGGYELKPNKAMAGMNQDMTGAATVLGTMYALASTKQKVNVVGILPLVKNLINEKAMVVSDVYRACNGRSVEIVSNDAEGRLILADAIAYANKKYKPTKVFTIATLTGLTSICFGDYLTPYWATKGVTADAINKAAELSGDILVSLPLFADYFDLVNKSSPIADCANSTGVREASNGTAAAFLKEFSKCDDFVHFDIAGTNEFKKHFVNPLGLMLYFFAIGAFNGK